MDPKRKPSRRRRLDGAVDADVESPLVQPSSHYGQAHHQGSAGKTGRLLLLQPRLVNKLIMREATPRMILPITTTNLAALMGAVLPIRQYLTKTTARLLLPCSKG